MFIFNISYLIKIFFMKYRIFDFKLNDIHFIKNIENIYDFIDFDKIRINIIIDN